MADPAPDVEDAVLSVTFDVRWMEITFVEPLVTTNRVQEIKTLRVDPTLVGEKVAAVQALLQEIIYEAQVEQRNPEKSFTRDSR